jgi:fibronectin type 3 domain-containing protein
MSSGCGSLLKGVGLAALLLAASATRAQTDVLVSHYDSGRTSANLSETTLNVQNVNSGTFGKLYSVPVDGYLYAQPLYKSNVTIAGKGVFNVVFAATQHGSVYAFDAASATPLWHRSFINPATGLTSRQATSSLEDMTPEVSITSTPVIDPASGTLYVVAETVQSGSPALYWLHALDIGTGADKVPAVSVQASMGSGATPLNINAATSQQRPGLVLVNGVVYLGFGSNGDDWPWVGWLVGYDATTLARVSVFCTSASGAQGAGVWSSGEAPPVDTNGNIFIATGNGTFNPASGDWADAYLKLSTTAGLAVQDYFSPFNQAALGAADLDVASAGFTLLPDAAGSATHPHLLIGTSKLGELYLVDRDNMGKFNGSYSTPNSQIVQWIPNAVGGITAYPTNTPLPYIENSYTSPAYWQQRVYFCGIGEACKAYAMSNGLLSPTPASRASAVFGFPGSQPAVSAAGSNATSALLWAIENDTTDNAAVLHAWDATNLTSELYNSKQAANQRDAAGAPVRFAVPTVANGQVFIGTQSEVDVYGLLGSKLPRLAAPLFAPTPGTYATAQTVTLTAAAGASIYYTLDGSAPTLASVPYTAPITVSATSTISAIAVQSGAMTSPVTSATYTIAAVAPIAFVQGNYATPQSAQTSVAVRYAAAQRQGDLNVAVVGWNDSTATVKSVTDTSGNTYTPVVGPTVLSGVASQTIYYAANIAGAAANANTVTVAFNGTALYPDVRILEYSGVATASPFEVGAAASGSSALASSGSATTTSAGDLLVGADLTVQETSGAGAGFTSRMITVPDADIAEDRIVNATGSYSATAPISPAGATIMQLAAFKAAAVTGGGGPTPSAPANLVATSAGATSISLTWTAATETGGTIASYLIERCAGAGCSSFAQVASAATTGFADAGLTASSSYTYRVRAKDAAGNTGPYSNSATAVTAGTAPSAPTNLAATATSNVQINLTWSAATEAGGTIAQYLIERCQGSGCASFSQVGTATTLSFGDSGLTGSTSYSYRVRARDRAGSTGPYSNIATAKTAAPTLTAPANLTATAASSSQINLAWSAATETGGTLSGYLIERCQGSGCSTFAQIATASTTSYSDTGVAASTSYSYRVRATDSAGDTGPYSGVATATTPSGGGGTPPPITLVQKNFATPQSAQSSVAVTFTAAQTSGDLNVVVVGWNDSTAAVGTVTDSSGNVYAHAVGPTVYAGIATQSIYYAYNISGAAANTNIVTVKFTGPAAYADVRILEYSGIDTVNPLDGAASAAAIGSSATASSGPGTTTYANDLLVGADITVQETTAAGPGFTARMITLPDRDIVEDQVVSSTGTYTATAAIAPAGQWIMQMVAFRRHP